MTTVRELLFRDPGKRIEPVVKISDHASLAEDLRQFVLTDSLAREVSKFLDAFTDSLRARVQGGTGSDSMAVWLSGFFGSGKSHLAKVLGGLLANEMLEPDQGRTAIQIFMPHLDDPTLSYANDIKASLLQIRNQATCTTLPFEIKSKQDPTADDSIARTCLAAFYESLSLSGTIWLARLEFKLQCEGLFEGFCSAYEAQNGRLWKHDRQEHAFYMDELTRALAAALGRTEASAREMIEVYRQDRDRVTPEGAIKEMLAYLESLAPDVAPREPHLIFVIDEMGQFVGDSDKLIHELQALVEQAGNLGKGRIWFICTSQEALDQVVDRAGLKLNALGKLDARFGVRIALTSENVRRVVQERLLRKREKLRAEMAGYYKTYEGALYDLADLHLSRSLATLDTDSFIDSYPFMPNTVPLVQDLFTAMRGFKLSGSERSMISVVQGCLRHLADKQLGVLASLDLVFDQVADELSADGYLGSAGMRVIREADTRIDPAPGKPLACAPSRVLKALWLIQRVDWVPRTPEVLAKLLADGISDDIGRLRQSVADTLARLQEAGLVGVDEATGQYRYLTEVERGLEAEIIALIREMGLGVARRQATALLKEHVLVGAKWDTFRVPLGKSTVPYGVLLDGEAITSAGEITLRISSPLSSPDLDALRLENLARGTRGRDLWLIAAGDPTLIDRLKRLEALEKVPQLPRWASDRAEDTPRLLREKVQERALLAAHLAIALENGLKRGTLLYGGESAQLDGRRELKAIAAEFVGAVANHLYTRHSAGDKVYDEHHIADYLRPSTKNTAQLDPQLGLFDAEGHLILGSPLVAAVFEELRRCQDESRDLDGKSVVEHFEAIPFGWPRAVVRMVLAAMLRGGALYLEAPDSDQPIYDLSYPGLESLFTSTLKFNKTRFVPTIGALTPAEVTSARQTLTALGETSVPESTHGLAGRVRSLGQRFVSEAEEVRQRVVDLHLPLPETYKQTASVTEKATLLRDPTACVRRFLEDRDSWLVVGKFLSDYKEFRRQRLPLYTVTAAVLDFARDCPAVFAAEGGDQVRSQLDEFDTIVADGQIMAKWPALQEAARIVTDRYRTVYRAAYEAYGQAITALREEIATSEVFLRLEPERRRKVLAAWFDAGKPLAHPDLSDLATMQELRELSLQRKVSELDALRYALPGRRGAILDMCDDEWAEQIRPPAGPDTKVDKVPVIPIRRVFRLNAHARLAGKRFVTKAEFEAFWSDLTEEIRAKLDEGFEVVLNA
jgi:hypothetical protein